MRYVGDYIGAVEAEKRKISESLVNGNAMTFDAYQRLVGQHQGLVKALEILNDLLKEEDDDN
jgi:uncharacterized protein (UPF0254 family)